MFVCVCNFYVSTKCKLIFLSQPPTNSEGSVPCFQIPRLGSVQVIAKGFVHGKYITLTGLSVYL